MLWLQKLFSSNLILSKGFLSSKIRVKHYVYEPSHTNTSTYTSMRFTLPVKYPGRRVF